MIQRKNLSERAKLQLAQIIKSFTKVLEDNCDQYAFYYGEIYSEKDLICFNFKVSDIRGKDKDCNLIYNPANDELSYTNLKPFHHEDRVIKAIVEFVSRLERCNQPISFMRFDFADRYDWAYVLPSTADPDCVKAYLLSQSIKDLLKGKYK